MRRSLVHLSVGFLVGAFFVTSIHSHFISGTIESDLRPAGSSATHGPPSIAIDLPASQEGPNPKPPRRSHRTASVTRTRYIESPWQRAGVPNIKGIQIAPGAIQPSPRFLPHSGGYIAALPSADNSSWPRRDTYTRNAHAFGLPAGGPIERHATVYTGTGFLPQATLLLTSTSPIVGILDNPGFNNANAAVAVLSDGSIAYGQAAGLENPIRNADRPNISGVSGDRGSAAAAPINPAAPLGESFAVANAGAIAGDPLAGPISASAYDQPSSSLAQNAMGASVESAGTILLASSMSDSGSGEGEAIALGMSDFSPGPELSIARDATDDGAPSGIPSGGSMTFEGGMFTTHVSEIARPTAAAPEPSTILLLLFSSTMVLARRGR